MSYNNADGLYTLTDAAQGAVNNTGSAEYGPKFLVINIPAATAIGLATTAPTPNDAYIPAGAYITKASLVVTTAFTGTSAALNIGLQTLAGAAIAAQGIDAAVAVTDLASIGKAVACNGTYVAGTTTVGSANAYVSFDYDTAAFTAGAGKLVIEYIG
jgi:hypothetical protein